MRDGVWYLELDGAVGGGEVRQLGLATHRAREAEDAAVLVEDVPGGGEGGGEGAAVAGTMVAVGWEAEVRAVEWEARTACRRWRRATRRRAARLRACS